MTSLPRLTSVLCVSVILGIAFNPAPSQAQMGISTAPPTDNASPVAESDSFSTPAGQPLTVGVPGVLGNDSDPDGDSLAASLVSGTTDGSLTLEEDGSFEYVPDSSFTGTDSLTYAATDVGGRADTALVSINVRKTLSRTLSVGQGWNMVGLPLESGDESLDSILPEGCGPGYRWQPADGSYQVFDGGQALPAGQGAWTFCSSADTTQVSGPVALDKTVQVEAGWNQVGPFETDIDPGEVGQDPSGLLEASTWFRWDPSQGSYSEPQALEAGNGYWVFATESGTLDFFGGSSASATASTQAGQTSAPEKLEDALTLRVTDQAGRQANLHLVEELTEAERRRWRLPPQGPGDGFDARFENGLQMGASGAVLEAEGTEGRVDLRLQVSEKEQDGRALRVVDVATGGDIFEEQLSPESPAAQIPERAERLRLSFETVPEEAALRKPSPHPVRGAVTLEYVLPEDRETDIKIYDVLGREVATLASGKKETGVHQATLGAGQLSSGTYFVQMQAGDFQETRKMTVVR